MRDFLPLREVCARSPRSPRVPTRLGDFSRGPQPPAAEGRGSPPRVTAPSRAPSPASFIGGGGFGGWGFRDGGRGSSHGGRLSSRHSICSFIRQGPCSARYVCVVVIVATCAPDLNLQFDPAQRALAAPLRTRRREFPCTRSASSPRPVVQCVCATCAPSFVFRIASSPSYDSSLLRPSLLSFVYRASIVLSSHLRPYLASFPRFSFVVSPACEVGRESLAALISVLFSDLLRPCPRWGGHVSVLLR